MAFLAKQFMSLLLLLIISRLILSTHAVRQHFSQIHATTTATTNSYKNPNNNDKEFSKTQPAFYPNKYEQHGLGTPPPPSFLPSNYDSVMYTTSEETQKNMYSNQEKAEPKTVAEIFGADNPFDEEPEEKKPTTSLEKQTEMNNQFYYSNKYNNDAKQFYYKDNNYDKLGGNNWNTAAAEYRSRYNKANLKDNKAEEEEEEEEVRNNNLPHQFYYKANPEDNKVEEEEDSKLANQYNNEVTYSNSKYEELYPQQYNNKWSYTNSKINGEYQQYKNKWAQQNTFTPAKAFGNFAETDDELSKLLDEDDEVKAPAPPSKRQGMSDTRYMDTYYNVDKEKYVGNSFNTKKYANAFSGDALSYYAYANANANQNP